MPPLVESGLPFDLGFVDGNHRFEGAFMDIFYMSRIVKPGGVILVDDTWLPGVQCAVNFFTTNKILEPAPDMVLRAGVMANTAALRVPMKPEHRSWNEFVPFGHAG